MAKFILKELPPKAELETKVTLKQASLAHRYLAELKGVSSTIPNQGILINALSLEEAKDSSAIENIITTHDEMYKAELDKNLVSSIATKEVQNYASALKTGFSQIKKDNLLTTRHILSIHEILEENNAGFRKQAGTELKNLNIGEIVYTPPQDYKKIVSLVSNLENYINDDQFAETDLLIKMAVIHYQFESIHPFYDGNGRTGRIINILYLVLKGLLDIPTLYLSRYIIESKSDYYRLLQGIRDNDDWETWIIYLLKGVEITAQETILIIFKIREIMQDYKMKIRKEFKFYSQDLIINLFKHPYTKIEFLEKDLNVSRITATKYLDQLANAGYLTKQKIWRNSYYINHKLFALLSNPPRL